MTLYKSCSSALLAALLLLSQGCSKEDRQATAPRNVILAQVSSLARDESTNYPGVVEEGASISTAFMAEGKISSIAVKEGDRVRKGQLLASLDDSDYRIGISQLQTQLEQMTKEKERMDAMYEKHNIAPNDYEKFAAGYKQLQLQLDMAQRKLDYTRLYAPSDGYIASRYMNPGELVGAGTPVFNIVDDSNLKASVDLPVSVYLNKDRIVKARGAVPGVDGDIPLTVVSFTPDADNNMLYRMKLSIPEAYTPALTSGMNISVWLETSEEAVEASMVPSRAIFRHEGKDYVWVFNPADSTINRKEVLIEGAPVGKMSVVKGLSNGVNVVETGVRQLYEGEKVNVLNRKDIGL